MLKGSIVALITPFTDNNLINYKKLLDLIEMHVYAGTDALVLLGTTAESTALSDKEKDELDIAIKKLPLTDEKSTEINMIVSNLKKILEINKKANPEHTINDFKRFFIEA